MSSLSTLDKYEKLLSKKEIAFKASLESVKQERLHLRKAKRNTKDISEAQQIAQTIASSIQQEAHKRISSIVSRALEVVFGENAYEFQIRFEKKRNKTEAKFVFVRDGKEYNPLRASGGGVVDLASFALRLSCLLLARPRCRKLLVLDEPLKHLSSDYRQEAAKMIELLSKEFDVQIVLVTHAAEFAIGKVIEL